MKAFFTLDDIDGVINVVDDVTREFGSPNILNNGTIYTELQWKLLEYFEKLADKGKVATVVNSYDGEVEEWEGDYDEEMR